MFVLVQFPLADLRSLAKEKRGRLPKPDWTADDPGPVFIRGFGAIAARNTSAKGLLGERYFADFDQAMRFREPIMHRAEGWSSPLVIHPWFRRFYFDGVISGRFELGFIVKDVDERAAIGSDAPIDARLVASAIAATRVTVIGSDVLEQNTTLGQIPEPMTLAYLADTTRKAALIDYPLTESAGRYVEVGAPIFHVRMTSDRGFVRGKDGQLVKWGVSELFLTSAADGQRRRNVIVQPSPTGAAQETGQERAVRVLFAHLNSLIFGLSKLVGARKDGLPGIKIEDERTLVAHTIERLSRFSPTGPKNDDDAAFSEALIGFARSYDGRVDELTTKLKALAEELKKPTAKEAAKGYANWVVELVIGKATETAVGAAIKQQGG